MEHAPADLCLGPHWNRLRDRNVMPVERELFESGLRSARSVLELLEKLQPHYQDSSKLIAVVKQGRQQLEEQMAQEREAQPQQRPQA